MPLLGKKVYNLAPLPKDVSQNEELFVILETKECFRSYDEYIKKVFNYGSQVWSCQYSGLRGMTYKEAMESEKAALDQLKDFPEYMKEPLLKIIHQGEGRLNDILVILGKKVRTEYFPKEEVYIIYSKKGKEGVGVIVDVIKSTGEKLESDTMTPDKENGSLSTQQEKIEYKYNINLTRSEVILSDISPDNIRRKTKPPGRELLKLFLKASAEEIKINKKQVWLVKDELIKKYHLPVVSKAKPELSQQKNPLRSPLHTISGPNNESVVQNKAKHSSKKSPKNNDSTQRTLCFIKEVKNDPRKATSTNEKDTFKKTILNGCLTSEIKVYLTPIKKQKAMVVEGCDVEKDDNRMKQKDMVMVEGCDVDEDDIPLKQIKRVVENSNSVKQKAMVMESCDVEKDDNLVEQKAMIVESCDVEKDDNLVEQKAMVVEDDNPVKQKAMVVEGCDVEKDDIPLKQRNKVVVEEQLENEDDSVKKIEEIIDNHEIFLIDDESNSNTVKDDNLVKQRKKAVKRQLEIEDEIFLIGDESNSNKTQENDLTIDKVNQELCKKDKKITKKNTMKKQKTISEMLNLCVSKKNENDQQKKPVPIISVPAEDNVLTQPLLQSSTLSMEEKLRIREENERKICELKELENERIHQAMLQAAMRYEESELVLEPLPSPKPVSVPDELKQYYGDILMIADFIFTYADFVSQEEEIKFTADELATCLMSRTAEFDLIQRILVVFLKILLKELHDNEINTDQIFQFGIDIFYVPLTKEAIGEVTRLYLEQDQKEQQSILTSRKKKTTKQPLELSLNILATLKEKEFAELSSSEKVEVLTYLLHRVLESDIFYNYLDGFDEKRKHNRVEYHKQKREKKDIIKQEKELGKQVKEEDETKETLKNGPTVTNEVGGDTTNSTEENEERNKYICNLTTQESMTKNKIDKENENEHRQFNEELYRKELKITQLKKAYEKDASRTIACGIDRDRTRYWLLPSHPVGLFVETTTKYVAALEGGDAKEELEEDKEENVLQKEEKGCWFYYDNIEDIEKLIQSLSNQGVNESVLKSKLENELTEMKINYMKRPTNEVTNSEEEGVGKDFLGYLKKELIDLGSRVTNDLMGDMTNLKSWVEAVDNCSSTSNMISYVVELGSSVKIKSFRKTKRLKDPEKWLNKKWIPAVQEAETTSRLHFCLTVLDFWIKWETCVLYLKCKICRKSGENVILCKDCRKAYHIHCIRYNEEECLKEWLCPSCKPSISKRRSVREEVDESGEEHENEDYCDFCCRGGELICCDSCPRAYHKQCHEPALRNTPRGIWKCKECQDYKRHKLFVIDDCSDSDFVDSSEEEKRVVKKGNATVDFKRKRLENKVAEVTRKRKNSPSNPERDEKVGGKRTSRRDPELQKCEELLKDLMKNEESWPFLEPIDLDEVTDYLEVVACPIDFETIKKKLVRLEYAVYNDCVSDIQLLFSNSRAYNVDTSDQGVAGKYLEKYFNEILPSYFPEYREVKQPARKYPGRNRKN